MPLPSPRYRDQIVVPRNGSRARRNWSMLVANSLPSAYMGPEYKAAVFPGDVHNWLIGITNTFGEAPRRWFALWKVGQSAGPGPYYSNTTFEVPVAFASRTE